jgi:hypothetical protein
MQAFYKTRGTDEQVRPISNKNLGKISPAALELWGNKAWKSILFNYVETSKISGESVLDIEFVFLIFLYKVRSKYFQSIKYLASYIQDARSKAWLFLRVP